MIFERIANGIQAHAKMIIVIWVVVLCIGGFFAIKANDVMSYDINEMAPTDSESIAGLTIIQTYFPSSSVDENSLPIIVLYYANGTEMMEAQEFVAALDSYAPGYDHILGVTAMDPMTAPAGDGIIMAFVMTDTELVSDAALLTPDVRKFIADVKDLTGYEGDAYLTGMAAISYDMEHNALEDISKIDPFTVLMILVLVGLFFRSFVSSATPPLTIGVAFAVTMGLIYGLGQIMNIFFITNMMILVSMMGAGCDYCIFIIARYREELREGLEHNEALHQAIVWAGESITISGASVIIGFGAISVCDYSLISTMGICLALGILIALIAALTLIPSILQVVGDRIFWPTGAKEYKEGGKATKGWYAWCGNLGKKYFHKSAKFSLKHAKAIAIVTVLVTVPAVYVMSQSEDSYDMISSMLSGDSGEGMEYIGDYADQGMVMPNYSIIEYKDAIAIITKNPDGQTGTLVWTDYWNDSVSPSLARLYADMESDPNVAYADGPFVWQDMLDGIEAAGITDVDEKIQYVKDHTSAKTGLIFNQMVETMTEMGMKPEYVFDGPGKMINDIFAAFTPSMNWNEEVAISLAKGLETSVDVIADIEARFAEKYPASAQILPMILSQLKASGITDDMLVYGMGPMVDSAMAYAHLEYVDASSWNEAVLRQMASGKTDPSEIVSGIVATFPSEAQPVVQGILANFYSQGITDALLVYGFGPVVDDAFSKIKVEFDWDGAVAQLKAMGITDPDIIVQSIEAGFDQQFPSMAGALTSIIVGLNEKGVSNDVLVNGFGPMVDYMMNIYASTLGGDYVKTGSGEASYISIVTATEAAAMSPTSMRSISAIADAVHDYTARNSGLVADTWNTGSAVIMYDVSEKVKQQFNFIEILVIVLILILLFVVMRSYLIPFRSVLTILMSITWTLAATHLIFVDLLGGDVLWLIPILLLVICLGLGMDYDILLTTRIKENVMALGMSNDDAIYHAVTHTGSVITICGLIMGGAFGTLMISGMPMFQQFGFALCFAILVDALIVRTYIVPAVMHLLGEWNWKGPGYKKRLQKLQEKQQ